MLNSHSRNFLIYRTLSRSYFHVLILFPFLLQMNFGLIWVVVLIAAYGAAATCFPDRVFTQLPAGSYRNLIVFGEVAKLIGIALLVLGTTQEKLSIVIVFLGQVCGGFGFYLCMKYDSKLLSLEQTSPSSSQSSSVHAIAQSAMFASSFVAGFLGILLYNIQPHWPFIASIAANVLTILALLTFPNQKNDQPETLAANQDVYHIPKLANFWIYYYATARSITLASFVCFIPFYLLKLQLEPLSFGLALSFFSFFAFTTAFFFIRIKMWFGAVKLFLMNTVIFIISLLIFAISGWVHIHQGTFLPVIYFAIGLMGVSTGLTRPLSINQVNAAIFDQPLSPSILSIMERRFGIISTVILIFGGVMLFWTNFFILMTLMILLIVPILLKGLHILILLNNES